MDIKWCECADRELSETEIGRLICAKCQGHVKCDFCAVGARPAASFPLGILVVAGKVVCSDHAWLAARLEKSAIEN
jgi:hypothetical protein